MAAHIFGKVWYEGLIFILQCNGISGNLLSFFQSYLNDRHQRVVLNGVQSNWVRLNAGVPQGSVLGPLLFPVYKNDLIHNISSNMKLYADYSSLFACVSNSTHNQMRKTLKQ